MGEFYRSDIKNRKDIVTLRPNLFNEKLVSIGLTPIKDLQQSVQTYKLDMYCKPVNFNIFLISCDKEANLTKFSEIIMTGFFKLSY